MHLRVGRSNPGSFPLTPALSPRERETSNPTLEAERSCGLAEDGKAILPLRWGEGRGEGEVSLACHNALNLVRADLRKRFRRLSKSKLKTKRIPGAISGHSLAQRPFNWRGKLLTRGGRRLTTPHSKAVRKIPTGFHQSAQRWTTQSAYAGWANQMNTTLKGLHHGQAMMQPRCG